MAEYALRLRRGLGPRVDPHFDARVGRIVARSSGEPPTRQHGSGYIELIGERPYDYLKALLEAVYDQTAHPVERSPWRRLKELVHARPLVWKQIRRLRYLTTDESTGLSLPIADLNPNTSAPDWPKSAPDQLASALSRLERVAGKRLESAKLIGLTVDFEFGILARRLRSILRPGILRRFPWMRARTQRALIEQELFGGLHPILKKLRRRSVQYDAQDIALSGGFSPQIDRAIRDLRAESVMSAPTVGNLDYGISETGQGVIVGVVDFGCDFAHSSFRDGAESRILALWDQNANAEPTLGGAPIVIPERPDVMIGDEACTFDYGRVFKKEHIDSVLAEWLASGAEDTEAPYGMLGYHPHDHHFTSVRPGPGHSAPKSAHGTFVLELAAGRRRLACRRPGNDGSNTPTVSGVAPNADIVFVQVRTHYQYDGRKLLDANDVVDAVAFIFHLADQKGQPCVVNLSLNTMSGPHDGDGHFERRLSALLTTGKAGPTMKGRAVTIAAGNLPDYRREKRQWQHIAAQVSGAQPFEFYWHPPVESDQTRNSIEVWYDASNAWLRVSLVSPAGETFGPVNPGVAAEIITGGDVCGSIIGSRYRPAIRGRTGSDANDVQPLPGPSDDHVQGRHVILLELDPVAAVAGCWTVVVTAVDQMNQTLPAGDARSIGFHAWLERDDNGQSGINRANPPGRIPDWDRTSTIGTFSCGEDAIVVGAYNAYWPQARVWNHSGHGPPRTPGAEKPDISAPGSSVLIINSTQDMHVDRCWTQSGTSLAAPLVAGTIACLYQVAPDAEIATIKTALFSTARKNLFEAGHVWHPQLGHGRLSPHAAVAWMRNETQGEDA